MHSKAVLACKTQSVQWVIMAIHRKKYYKNPEHTPVENSRLVAATLALMHNLVPRGWAVVTSPVGWGVPVPA